MAAPIIVNVPRGSLVNTAAQISTNASRHLVNMVLVRMLSMATPASVRPAGRGRTVRWISIIVKKSKYLHSLISWNYFVNHQKLV